MYVGLFLYQNMFLISNGTQLTSADIGPKFAILMKIKHIGHGFHSVLSLEFEFKDKNNNFWKMSSIFKISWNLQIFRKVPNFGKFLFLPSNSNSGTKTKRETCLICLIFFKLANSSPMSADVSWFSLDFKNIFWHKKKPTNNHKQIP